MPYKDPIKKKENKLKYYILNKEKILSAKKKYYYKNKKIILKKMRENYDPIKTSIKNKIYRIKYKEKLLESKRKYYFERGGKEKVKKYRLKNKKKLNEWARKYRNKKLKIDPNYKLAKNIRSRIRMALIRNSKSKKANKTINLIGCTIEELWIHLEKSFKSGMTKENYGKWHVDHIRPCASFDLTKPKEQIKCFHYTNLQALWQKENILKSDKII